MDWVFIAGIALFCALTMALAFACSKLGGQK